MVWGAVTTYFSVYRHRFGEDFLFQRQVGIKIDLSGFYRLVPQPKGDHGSINASLQQLHRALWRSECGVIRFLTSDEHFTRAATTCLFTKSWTASALSLPPERLGKRNLLESGQGSFIQASSTRRVVLDMGVQRCFRPLPTHWMCAPGPSITSSRQSPVSSDKRKPVCMATSSKA